MNKIILLIFLTFCISHISNAQIRFGVKGGINYNYNSFSNVKNDVLSGAKIKAGFHTGIWLRAKIPIIGFYIRPELVYTRLRNNVIYSPETISSETVSYNFNKLDIPVLLGKKIFGVCNIFAGPSFQYMVSSDFSVSDLKNVNTSGFTVGIQFGGGIEIGKFEVDIRWEKSLSGIETSFLGRTIQDKISNINFDTRINQIIIGLSYRL